MYGVEKYVFKTIEKKKFCEGNLEREKAPVPRRQNGSRNIENEDDLLRVLLPFNSNPLVYLIFQVNSIYLAQQGRFIMELQLIKLYPNCTLIIGL